MKILQITWVGILPGSFRPYLSVVVFAAKSPYSGWQNFGITV
jgi:hypothetical protein